MSLQAANRAFKRLSLIFILLALAGCTLRFTYALLPSLAMWELDDYIDFTREQRQQTKAAVKDLVEWHRYQELPTYISKLDQLAALIVSGNVTPAQVSVLSKLLVEDWQRVVRQIVPGAADLLTKLDSEQVEHLEKQMTEQEQEDREDWQKQGEEEHRNNAYKYLYKQIKRITGRPGKPQKAIIRQWGETITLSGELRFEQAEIWRKAFLVLIRNHQHQQNFETQLETLMVQPDELWSEEYRAIIESNQKITEATIAEIINSLDDKQREKAARRIRDLQEEILAVSKTERRKVLNGTEG